MNVDTFLSLETIRTGTIDTIRSSSLAADDRVRLAIAFEQFYADYLHRLNSPPPAP